MRYQKSLRLFVAVALLTSCVHARQKPAAGGEPDLKRLRGHVEVLASGEFEGRKTGSEGATQAARYIADEFHGYGLDCPAPNSACHHTSNNHLGYMKPFPYVAAVEPGKANALTLSVRPAGDGARAETLDLRLGDDWMPLGFTADARVEAAPVAFVGYAIKSAETNYDDFAGAGAPGRVALAFAATPGADNPHNPLARHAALRLRAAAARAAGATALLLIAREDNFKDDTLARLSYDNAGGDAGLPVAVISRQAAARLLGAGSVAGLAEHEAALLKRAAATPGAPRDAVTPTVPDGTTLTLATEVTRRQAPAYNVVGILAGSDAKLKDEVIVVGAHYDHLGRGGRGSRAGREGDVHHGADDNASGVAALLELARLLASERRQMRRTVVFVAFGGEEEGLLGSSFYVDNPALPLAQTVAMINLDMVGRLRDERLMVGGVGTAAEWRPLLERANAEPEIKVDAAAGATAGGAGRGTPVVTGADGRVAATAAEKRRFALALNEDGFGPSDHSSFYGKRVPVLFFFTGTHDDYHRPTDTAERINYDGLARVASFTRRVVRGIQESDARPTYTAARVEQTARSTGFRVYLGTVPSYGESTDGMKLEGVREGSPASAAGLRAGDRIVRLAGRDVRNVYDYTQALSEMKAGQEYEVEVVRGAERLKLKLTPAERK